MSDFTQLIRNFWIKLVNGLAHSRSGEESMSASYGPCKGTVWFNLATQEYDMVTTQIKKTGTDEPIGPGQTYFVQFYLFTKEKRVLVLETWELSASQTPEYVPKPLYLTVIEKMSGILKTVLMYSKHTTAHKCSLNQSPNWYIFCLKVGSSIPDHDMLGYDHESVQLGHLFTPTVRLNISVHYRTKFALPILGDIPLSMMPIDPDHFKVEPESKSDISDTISDTETITPVPGAITVGLPDFGIHLPDIDFPFTSDDDVFEAAEPCGMFVNLACSVPREKPQESDNTEVDQATAELRDLKFGEGTEMNSCPEPLGQYFTDELPTLLTMHTKDSVDFYDFPCLSKKSEKRNVPEKLDAFSKHNEKLENVIDFATQKSQERESNF